MQRDILKRILWNENLSLVITEHSARSISLVAEALERQNEWFAASEAYRKTRGALPREDPSRPVLSERAGWASFRAAMQGANLNESRNRMTLALADFDQARALYGKGSSLVQSGRRFRCEAQIAHLRFWLSDHASEKRKALFDSWSLAKSSLGQFEQAGDGDEFGLTYNMLSDVPFLLVSLSNSFKLSLRVLREAISLGEKAIERLDEAADVISLVRACVKTVSYLAWMVEYTLDSEEKEHCLLQGRRYWTRAKTLARTDTVTESIGVDSYSVHRVMTPNETVRFVEENLKKARTAKDKFALGAALEFMVCLEWDEIFVTTEDVQERRRLSQLALKHSEEALQSYDVIGFTSPLCFYRSLWSAAPLGEFYRGLGQDVESDPHQRRLLLRKASDAAPAMLKRGKACGYQSVVLAAHRIQGKVLSGLASLERDSLEKIRLLDAARAEISNCVRLSKRFKPGDYFSNSSDLADLSEVNSQLADLIKSPAQKASRLREAERQIEESILLGNRDVKRLELQGWRFYGTVIGTRQSRLADLLDKTFETTDDKNALRRAAQAAEDAANTFQKLKLNNRVAEALWKRALVFEKLDEHARASESYDLASKSYSVAAQQIPALRELYEGLSAYMNARREIAKGRDSHNVGEYALAEEYYRNAALLLESHTHRNYLLPGLLALAQLEAAEQKSVRQLSDEASVAFDQAAQKFHESRISIEAHLVDEESPEIIRQTEMLAGLTLARELYCTARADYEEARVFQLRGEHKDAGEKYNQAIERLRTIGQRFQTGPDKVEANFVIALSEAWRAMAQAEVTASPELYRTASRLFDRAKDSSPSEHITLLLMGHSHYCSSLQATSQFIDTGKVSDYNVAVQRLESAVNYYTKSGFHDASEEAKGTKRLLEAHLYLARANKESDQGKKAQLYDAVERLLRASAEAFGESGHVAKKGHINSLLDRVREDKELAISLTNGIAAPFALPLGAITSSLESQEDPVGIDRLQGAFVVVSLFPSPTSLKLGEPMSLKVQLANAGMNTAQLLRVEQIEPEGFELVDKPREFVVEDGDLILQGRRLEPSKTEDLSFTLKPKVEGTLSLRPRVLYLDENGKSRVHEPDSLRIVVKDHPGNSQIPSTQEWENLHGSIIMKFLANGFAEDYVRRRFSLDLAGWRGLLDIVRSTKVPRSQVYGDSRYRHTFGKPLERLVKTGFVEFRIFPGMRGRGGKVVKVRVAYENELVKRFIDGISRDESELTPLAKAAQLSG